MNIEVSPEELWILIASVDFAIYDGKYYKSISGGKEWEEEDRQYDLAVQLLDRLRKKEEK